MPRTDSHRLGTLTKGDKGHVTACKNKWCWAKLPDDSQGWIAEWLLEFSYDKGRQLTDERGSSSVSSSSSPPAWVKVSAVNVRSGPGLGYESYGTLVKGTKLYKLDQRGEWVECKTPGGSGWIRGDLLEFDVQAGQKLASSTTSSSQTSAKGYVNGNNVRLRSGPGTNHRIVATLKKGQTVYVYDSQGDWKKVTVHGGHTGWIADSLLTYEDEKRPAPIPLPPPPADFPSPHSGEASELCAWIDEPRVNVRSGPSQNKEVKFQLTHGQKVTVVDVSGHWCKIKTADGQTGWIAGWVIDFSPPGVEFMREEGGADVEVKVGWVARSVVNLRSGPGLNYPEIADLTLSTQIIIIGQKGDWYKVALDNGKTGWAASWLIDTRAQRLARQTGGPAHLAKMTSKTGKGTGTAIVETAMNYLGAPYVRGAEGPRAFDCSGFVQYILARYGLRVARTSADLFRQGQPVSRSSLQPGDIVFFKNTYRRGISHVGIYVSGDKFIHASNSRSSVKISSLSSSYYAPRYIGARRMH